MCVNVFKRNFLRIDPSGAHAKFSILEMSCWKFSGIVELLGIIMKTEFVRIRIHSHSNPGIDKVVDIFKTYVDQFDL